MKIAVTGPLGHIGSRVIRDLAVSFPGCEILLIDNFRTKRYASLSDLPTAAQYPFTEADILTADLARLFQGASAVIHLAALPNSVESFQNSKETWQVNYEGTVKVAEACLAAGAALFFPSTASVYAKPSGFVAEDCRPEDLKPQSPYAETKLRAETYLQNQAGPKGSQFFIARFGTIFGVSPGMQPYTAIHKFCLQAILGEPLTVWNTAWEQRRPYLDLSDASRLISFVLTHDLFDNQVYNVATLHASTREIVEKLQARVPGLKVEFVDSPTMNPFNYEVVVSRLVSAGFQCLGSLEKGLDEILRRLSDLPPSELPLLSRLRHDRVIRK